MCRYNGGCLLDIIDSIPPLSRDISKPLILPICDVISSRTLGQLAVSGKLEAGAVRVGSKVCLLLLISYYYTMPWPARWFMYINL